MSFDITSQINAEIKYHGELLTKALRKIGIKACHPNDGWVKRDKDGKPYEVTLCYPEFNDKPQIGEKIALVSYSERDIVDIFYCRGCFYVIARDTPTYLLTPTDESYLFNSFGQLNKQQIIKNKKFSLKQLWHDIIYFSDSETRRQ